MHNKIDTGWITVAQHETEVPGAPFPPTTKYFWLRVFGTPTIYMIPVV